MVEGALPFFGRFLTAPVSYRPWEVFRVPGMRQLLKRLRPKRGAIVVSGRSCMTTVVGTGKAIVAPLFFVRQIL